MNPQADFLSNLQFFAIHVLFIHVALDAIDIESYFFIKTQSLVNCITHYV